MATRTRTSAKMRTMNPSRVQIQPPTPVDDDAEVKCSGHQMKCPKLRAGPTTRTPEERFTATLGQSPQARYGRPLGNPSSTPRSTAGPSTAVVTTTLATTPIASRTRPPAPVIEIDGDEDEDEDEMEEIDWDKVDADEMERVAIASTPGSSQPASQRTPTHVRNATDNSSRGHGQSLTDRLKDAAGDALGKRSRGTDEEGEDAASSRTPKRNLTATDSNPFISSPSLTGRANASNTATPRSPPHSYLSPTLSSLEQLSEHLYRQDRLLRAAEQMKKGMRTTIKGLQDRNKELEDKVKELEKRLGGT
ncbi:hypothetical protein IAT40_006136 [Kwoniella sp. CBS 6097]